MSQLAQYFTDSGLLQSIILSLCSNRTKCLEPSAGAGHLVKYFEDNGVSNITSVELDETLVSNAETIPLNMDFFDYPLENKFDTVFGNPPFIQYKYIMDDTKEKIKDSKLKFCNLFCYFIEKAYYHLEKHGELVFIAPKEFLNSTRAAWLRNLLFTNGTITDVYDFSGSIFFKDAAPEFIIFRYKKGDRSHVTNFFDYSSRKELWHNGSILMLNRGNKKKQILGEVFDIKVGLVTGANEVFNNYQNKSKFLMPTICSNYRSVGLKNNVIFLEDISDIELLKELDSDLYNYMIKYKKILLKRRLKKFDDTNWYKYGAIRNRKLMEGSGKMIFVNQKTRVDEPFFVEDVSYFDGSILGLFPLEADTDLDLWCNKLNYMKDSFNEQGLMAGNRYIFTAKTLSDFIIGM